MCLVYFQWAVRLCLLPAQPQSTDAAGPQLRSRTPQPDWTLGHCRGGPGGKYLPMALLAAAATTARLAPSAAARALVLPQVAPPAAPSVAPAAVLAPPRPPPRRTIGWAISVSADGPFVDGAAVLLESIKRTHHDPQSEADATERDDGEGGGYGLDSLTPPPPPPLRPVI
jgi:hypothetical protein